MTTMNSSFRTRSSSSSLTTTLRLAFVVLLLLVHNNIITASAAPINHHTSSNSHDNNTPKRENQQNYDGFEEKFSNLLQKRRTALGRALRGLKNPFRGTTKNDDDTQESTAATTTTTTATTKESSETIAGDAVPPTGRSLEAGGTGVVDEGSGFVAQVGDRSPLACQQQILPTVVVDTISQ